MTRLNCSPGVPFKLRKKICRNRYENEDGEVFELSAQAYKYYWLPKRRRTQECDGYGISYLKGKHLSVCKIKWNDIDKQVLRWDAIIIYDVYSFYGMGLVKVLKSLVDLGYVTEVEYLTIKANKERREDFDDDELTFEQRNIAPWNYQQQAAP